MFLEKDLSLCLLGLEVLTWVLFLVLIFLGEYISQGLNWKRIKGSCFDFLVPGVDLFLKASPNSVFLFGEGLATWNLTVLRRFTKSS